MHRGRPAGRIVLAVALLALPLVGLVLLTSGGWASGPGPREAVLRLAPGQTGDAQAVRSGPEADAGERGATTARGGGLVAVLLGATAALAAAGYWPGPPLRAIRLRTDRGLPALGRGPPLLLPR